MKMQSYCLEKDRVLIETDKGRILIQACSCRVLRVVYTRENAFKEDSLIVINRSLDPVSLEAEECGGTLRVKTGLLTLGIDKQSCAFRYYDNKGALLAKEPDKGGKLLSPVEVEVSVFDRESKTENVLTADGIRAKAADVSKRFDRNAWEARLDFEWQDGEALYGLGSHEEGVLNLRGSSQLLYQQNMKAVVPVLVSTNGYGVLFDSCGYMEFHDDMYGSYVWCDTVDQLDFYFMRGGMDEVVSCYRQLTGKAVMPSKAAFGYVQSKERYKTQQEMLEIANEFARRDIPLSVLVLDWMSWPEGLWGQKTFDRTRFPDPRALTGALHDMGVEMMISIWPNLLEGGENHREMRDMGYLLGNNSSYNAFDEGARAMYFTHANEGLFSQGIDCWWCDCTEPFEADWKGEKRPEPSARAMLNVGEAKKYLDPSLINAYSLQHSRGIYENQRKTGNKRVTNLTRSSYAGQQRYGTIVWSGDICASWETLRRQIPAGLNFSATGCPYWTFDIGGFFVKNKPDMWFWSGEYDGGNADMGYRELYVRWLQAGAFMPMFRSHGTDTEREPWFFGEEGDIFYDTIVRFIRLRHRLMPAIYSMAARVYRDDYTMLRPLAFDFARDPNVFDIATQYMFGDFMVCPVLEPMYYHAGGAPVADAPKTRGVYLPKGARWYDFYTGAAYDGGRSVTAKADITTMPLYVRAGAILPMLGDDPSVIDVRIYPGSDGEFTLYDDDGKSYDYEKHIYSKVDIRYADCGRAVRFSGRSGSYQTGGVTFRLLDETGALLSEVSYSGEAVEIKLPR